MACVVVTLADLALGLVAVVAAEWAVVAVVVAVAAAAAEVEIVAAVN